MPDALGQHPGRQPVLPTPSQRSNFSSDNRSCVRRRGRMTIAEFPYETRASSSVSNGSAKSVILDALRQAACAAPRIRVLCLVIASDLLAIIRNGDPSLRLLGLLVPRAHGRMRIPDRSGGEIESSRLAIPRRRTETTSPRSAKDLRAPEPGLEASRRSGRPEDMIVQSCTDGEGR